jgi:DNA-binding response OmpR family regulator
LTGTALAIEEGGSPSTAIPETDDGRVCISVTNAESSFDAPSQPRRVLFVNADAELCAVVSRVLERENFHVHAVAHSGHAVLVCRTQTFDVVVAELSGPDMSGPALVEQLRRLHPGLPSVYLAQPGTPDGIDHLLVRPFTKDDLVRRLDLALSNVAA